MHESSTYSYSLFLSSTQYIHPILHCIPAAFPLKDIGKLHLMVQINTQNEGKGYYTDRKDTRTWAYYSTTLVNVNNTQIAKEQAMKRL